MVPAAVRNRVDAPAPKPRAHRDGKRRPGPSRRRTALASATGPAPPPTTRMTTARDLPDRRCSPATAFEAPRQIEIPHFRGHPRAS